MPLTKEKVRLDCENCRYCGEWGSNSFELEVPVEDGITGLKGQARIACEVAAGGHRITLIHFHDLAGNEQPLDTEQRRRLDSLLQLVAEKELCGNERLCPKQVVDRVQARR